MEIISYLTIVVNTCIIYFTGDSTVVHNGVSSFVKFMRYQDADKWVEVNIILLAICIEHVLFMVKLVIAAAIPDVPNSVVEAEAKRDKVKVRACKYINNVLE
jgi:uncharacterized membrane protein